MEVAILRGVAPNGYGYGDGYGDGDGYGSGYGYGSGSSDGSGYGSGYGYGDGYGYGYGSGYGSGSGSGYGYGYGYGSGDGYGYGYGSGPGYGYGYGSGDGDGSGYGDGEYWEATIDGFAAQWPADRRDRLSALRAEGAVIAFWRSDKDGRACNGGENKPVQPGTVETENGPLELCGRHTLHATLIPPKWDGVRWWIVALIGDVVGDKTKFGALKREIIGECL